MELDSEGSLSDSLEDTDFPVSLVVLQQTVRLQAVNSTPSSGFIVKLCFKFKKVSITTDTILTCMYQPFVNPHYGHVSS